MKHAIRKYREGTIAVSWWWLEQSAKWTAELEDDVNDSAMGWSGSGETPEEALSSLLIGWYNRWVECQPEQEAP